MVLCIRNCALCKLDLLQSKMAADQNDQKGHSVFYSRKKITKLTQKIEKILFISNVHGVPKIYKIYSLLNVIELLNEYVYIFITEKL